jgi:ubiquinone/menaquinone biosynthesis C-methylase UbiE
MLSWFMAKYYDKIMKDAEERCLQDWRASLLSQALGAVLEIGPGTGANLPFYPSTVSSLTLLEPEKNMARQLNEKLSNFTKFPIKLLSGNAESIPFPDATFHTVVSTLVLCSVKNPEQALAELNRVLVPDGKLIFIEHVAACKETARFKWQRRFEPLWKFVALGCHVTRETETLLTQSGFEIKDITRQSIRGVPPIVRPSIRGIAVKKAPDPLPKTK